MIKKSFWHLSDITIGRDVNAWEGILTIKVHGIVDTRTRAFSPSEFLGST